MAGALTSMKSFEKFLKANYSEILYQLVITLVLFIFFSHSREGTESVSFSALFAPYKIAFFGNYLTGVVVINYILLPFLYYKNKPFSFAASVVFLLAVIVLVDEYFLERLYFPETRGTYFPGVAFTIIETLPLILIFVLFKLAWDFNRKQRELDRLKSLVQESEIKFLKSQVNPHFLFNNLNNLYAKALKQSPKTPEIILELSSVLRFMLYDSKEAYIPLSREIEHLKNYTSLYVLQIENRGDVRFDTDLTSSQFLIPPLLLVVFVENAFKHSTGSQSADIRIEIALSVSQEGQLTFICKNNYSSEYQADQTASGIGLENVKMRLKLLCSDKHQLKIAKDEEIFEVSLQMQLKPLGTP